MLLKFLTSTFLFFLTLNSAAETEVARLILSEAGENSLTCVVYAEDNGTSFEVRINDVLVAGNNALVEAIKNKTLIVGQAFCLLERA